MPSNDLDDLFGFGVPNSQGPATASIPVSSVPSAPQYSSRRAQREAEASASAALPKRRVQAATNRHTLSRDVGDRRAVSRAARSIDAAQPASRKLRRSEVAAMHASAPKTARKHPVSVLATMAVVGGMFAVAGLPAYAMSTPGSTVAGSDADVVLSSQSVAVSKDAVATPLLRDGYRATTPEQMAEMSKDEIRAQNNADYIASGARALGDDYPWYYELADYQGGGLSPLNYYYRQCTDFVAWRLNRDAGAYDAPYKYVWSTLTPTGGNASQWKSAWDAQGWTTSATPIVGSVAWFGWSNHVAYVKAVLPDGNVVIEEYNYVPSVYSQRTIPAASVASFLYPPTYAG